VGVTDASPFIRGSLEPPSFAPEPIAVLAGESELNGCSAARRVPAGGLGAGVEGFDVGFGDDVGLGFGLGFLVCVGLGEGLGFFVFVGLGFGLLVLVGPGRLGADFVVVGLGLGLGLADPERSALVGLGCCEASG